MPGQSSLAAQPCFMHVIATKVKIVNMLQHVFNANKFDGYAIDCNHKLEG